VQEATHRPFKDAEWDLDTLQPTSGEALDNSKKSKGT
jgi:hypothetical protein